MNKSIKDKSVNCPGCGQIIVLDKLKKHIKREHGFQEPFSLSQAVFTLSKGNITASDLYSYVNTKIPAKEHHRLIDQAKQKCRIPVASGYTLRTRTVNSNDRLVKEKQTRQPNTTTLPQNSTSLNEYQSTYKKFTSGKCWICNNPSIPGDNVCYFCKSD